MALAEAARQESVTQTLSSAFEQQARVLEEVIEADDHRRKQQASRMIACFINSTLWHAFEAWVHFLQECKRLEATQRKSKRRLLCSVFLIHVVASTFALTKHRVFSLQEGSRGSTM